MDEVQNIKRSFSKTSVKQGEVKKLTISGLKSAHMKKHKASEVPRCRRLHESSHVCRTRWLQWWSREDKEEEELEVWSRLLSTCVPACSRDTSLSQIRVSVKSLNSHFIRLSFRCKRTHTPSSSSGVCVCVCVCSRLLVLPQKRWRLTLSLVCREWRCWRGGWWPCTRNGSAGWCRGRQAFVIIEGSFQWEMDGARSHTAAAGRRNLKEGWKSNAS